ncbi:protein TolB [Alphaproteobacteria bacterium]|nr:protein TolB [Alphaproteobacteria bacterium]
MYVMKKMFFAFGLAIACVLDAWAPPKVIIDINRGRKDPVSIAIDVFDPSHLLMKDQFFDVVQNDLQGTYLFRSIPPRAFMQNLQGTNDKPKFSVWKTINAQYLASIEVGFDGNQLRVSLALYDVLSETRVELLSLSGGMDNWRKMAHMVANKIYERITGESGYFDTKMLYVSTQTKAKGEKSYRLAMMDQDGYAHKYLTDGNSIVLTPRFSPNGKECSFFGYRERVVNGRRVPLSAHIYRLDLTRPSQPQLFASFKGGMTYAPRYSPDGRLLIFSLSDRGSSSIYTLNMETKEIRRITRGRCIDTSPCYSPDGQHIVFNSDRGGTPQLYIMDSDGANIKRLSFSRGRYATPVWSPRGDWIAFTKWATGNNAFNIGVIRPDGTEEGLIASGYLLEGPSWSPNGRVIIFSHQDYSKREKIHSVDITGYNEHEVRTPFNAIDPEWSQRITN